MAARPTVRSFGLAVALILLLSGCSEVEQLAEEQSDQLDIDTSDFTVPDVNAPDFTVPEIVAPDIDIDIIEAPELPEIRFPEAEEIQVPEISNPDIVVAETDEETIYTIEGQVLFDFDQANLRPEAVVALNEIFAAIENRDFQGSIEIAGHTDAKGTAEYNHDLSVRRATGVALLFVEQFGEGRDIQAIGYGESQPIAANSLPNGDDNPDGRALNRRVEIIVSR